MNNRTNRVRRFAAATAVAGAVTATVLLAGCGAGRGDTGNATVQPLPSPSGTTQAIDRDNLLHLWPLTVGNGIIECRNGRDAVFRAPDGRQYALNTQAAQDGYADIGPLRASGADGTKISLGALLDDALALCSH